jgi:2-polyprenyl-3-methyl-5-hydroxy-6-metoxy-1,4-benzoquinol methylase
LLEERKKVCRLCGEEDSLKKLIFLQNFPKSAQFLPSVDEFGEDISIELQVAECIYCGLVQLINQPVSYYKDVITAASLTGASRDKLNMEFRDIIDSFSLDKAKTLEIGAGRGEFISLLNQLGLKAQGLENNFENVNIAMSNDLRVEQGYLLDRQNNSKSYRFIVCNNFLEHQPNIKRFLKKIHSIMDETGFVYLSVPNLERIIERGCFYEFVADHLVYFSKQTLKTAIENSGLVIERIYLKNNENDIAVLAKKRPSLDVADNRENMDLIINSVKLLVDGLAAQGKKISVWGAGHRALALMALAKLNKIDSVIDSAPFKQGRFTPILKKQIIGPDDFFSNEDCDCILVMLPGSFSEQVKSYLKEKNFSGEVFYFNDEIIELEG